MQQFSLFDGCHSGMQMHLPEALRSLDLYNCLYYSQESDSESQMLVEKIVGHLQAGPRCVQASALLSETNILSKVEKLFEGKCGTAFSCEEL